VKALFLSHQHSFARGGGGQQQCTREYREVLEAAGFDLQDVTFTTDRDWATRIKRKIWPRPYTNLIPEDFFLHVAEMVKTEHPSYIFCNLANFVPFATVLKAGQCSSKIVLLSHGLESVDGIHTLRIAQIYPEAAPKVSAATLGEMLWTELKGLPSFDHVFCLAPFEAEICRWLGARSVSWLPRRLDNNHFLEWNPIGNRIGCVGTFDHPPNLEGLELFCAALSSLGVGAIRLRLISRSRAMVASLRSRYRFVDDVGDLEAGNGLEQELATWNTFVHPIFCYARGCSTKIATSFSFGLPTLTTSAGLRGYTWKEGDIPIYETPEELAKGALTMLDVSQARRVRAEVQRAVATAPTLADIAIQVQRDLQPS
jgi:hypothetical protein